MKLEWLVFICKLMFFVGLLAIIFSDGWPEALFLKCKEWLSGPRSKTNCCSHCAMHAKYRSGDDRPE
jgi:hypothetical protein